MHGGGAVPYRLLRGVDGASRLRRPDHSGANAAQGSWVNELVGSDVILPPPDVTLEEAKAEFSGEGLIPG